MKYRLQSDILLKSICDEYFLIATGEARGHVPYIEGITRPGAYFWRLLEKGSPVEEIISQSACAYKTSLEKATIAFWHFAKMLHEKGYLTLDKEGMATMQNY